MEKTVSSSRKRKAGRPKLDPSEEKRRRNERSKYKEGTKIYLLDAHDEWKAIKIKVEENVGKSLANGEFAKELLSTWKHLHLSSCSTPSPSRPTTTSTSRPMPTSSTMSTSATEDFHRSEAVPDQVEGEQGESRQFPSEIQPFSSTPIKSVAETNWSESPLHDVPVIESQSPILSKGGEELGSTRLGTVDVLEVQDFEEELRQQNITIDDIEHNITVEEEVFDVLSDDKHTEQEIPDPSVDVNDSYSEDLIAQEKAITFVPRLVALLQKVHGLTCKHGRCQKSLVYDTRRCGTAAIISWNCSDGHYGGSWSSQPSYRGMYAGNLLLPSAILLSGNSFAKVSLMFRFFNLFCIGKDSLNRIQRLYIAPAVEEFWLKEQNSLLESYGTSSVVLAGDGRNDSPGHSAQYCVYSFTDEARKKVLHVEIVDVREVGGKSPNMEKLGFQRGLDKLCSSLNITEIVTDAHTQITALMKNSEKYSSICHQQDIWHGSKSLVKKLQKAAKGKENKALEPWIPSLRNHFWFSAKSCGGDAALMKASLLSVLHHIVNEHEWILGHDGAPGKCNHEELVGEERQKAWLQKGTKPHQVLQKTLTSKRCMKKMDYYKNFRHTGILESFHNHLLMYTPKRHAYSMTGFKLRTLLAAIDHNFHSDRQQATTNSGALRYRCKYSKRTKHFTPQAVTEPKTYSYIPALIDSIFIKRATTEGPLKQKLPVPADDPRRIHPRIAMIDKPSMKDLLEQHKSRFGVPSSSSQ